MEPLFQAVVTGVVPQPREMPPAPYPREALQRVFFDINEIASYRQFQFLPGDGGAQIMNQPGDQVMIQTGLIQIAMPVALTPEQAREKTSRLLKAITQRLKADAFLQCGVKVVAHVPAPGVQPNAKAFVAEQLMAGARTEELDADYFAAGVKYRRIEQGREDNLLIEPYIHDNALLFVDYDVQRGEQLVPLDSVSGWLDEAFAFVSGPAMKLLEV